MPIKLEWNQVKKQLRELIPNAQNPRTITKKKLKALEKSLEDLGTFKPIVCDYDGLVLGGNQRVTTFLSKFPADYEVAASVPNRPLTEEERQKVILQDNGNHGEWQMDALANNFDMGIIEELDIGITIAPVEVLPTEGLTDEDDVPEVKEPIVKKGDLWLLGDHRMLCGDCTLLNELDHLMNGKKADMIFTDPPYGIGFKYNQHEDEQGENYLEFCRDWYHNLVQYGDFIAISTGWKYNKFWYSYDPTDCFYWLSKNKRTGGKISHFRKVEPIFLWGKPANKYDFDFWEQTSEIEKELKGQHTCPKPVSLITSIIDGCKERGLLLDIFLGSGTTLIACEKTNRKCYGIEIDPHYCTVILNRWRNFTGKEPILESTGQTLKEIEAISAK